MKSKMPDDDMDYMDWSYKHYQDKKNIWNHQIKMGKFSHDAKN